MKPRIHVVALAVADLDRALAFYRDGLGFRTEGLIGTEFRGDETIPDGTTAVFHLDGGLMLSIYPRAPGVPCSVRTGAAGSRRARGGNRMDGPSVQYLQPIAGIEAAMWVPPSRGQLFWLRRAPALFAPALGTGRGLARWWVIATVTPATNVTGLNLAYQSYLNHVFHRTRLAKVGHAVCMPVIVTTLLALLYPVHATLPGALALAAWWAYWAVKERDPVWGGFAVGLAAALYPLALALGRLGVADPSPLAQPWVLLLLAGLPQAGSHVLEPLPPRVTRSVHWIPPAEYLLGRAGHRNPPGTAARRVGQLSAQAVFGTVDEIVASPRLLPVLLLELLWLFGHDPVRRAAWRALSARAIADGNPALDYIGTGGPTPLRAPV